MSTDIVVTGRRRQTAGGVVTSHGSTVLPENQAADSVAYDSQQPQNPDDVAVSVNVSLTNSANQAKAIEAAQNIANAVATIIAAASKLPPGTVINLPNGKNVTAGDLLTDIKRTKFIVTDVAQDNNGVGTANRATMTDTLHFESFAEITGKSSYSNSGYMGMGVVGAILHEIAHMTVAGDQNWKSSVQYFKIENAERKLQNMPFYGSAYGNANEMFAHYGGSNMASALGLDTSVYQTLMTSQALKGMTYEAPFSLYNSRKFEG